MEGNTDLLKGFAMDYVRLSWWDVGLASALLGINGLLSLLLQLKLGRVLFVAALRTIGQLLLIGSVLEVVFRLSRWYTVVPLLSLMTIVAGVAAVGRVERSYRGIYVHSIVAVWASAWLVAAYGLVVVLRKATPWYHPQFTIPLTGMILGNSLNGISLGLSRFLQELSASRSVIEVLLALGATRWEAARLSVRRAVRTGMTPVLNAMMVVGIVSLPGMMTGQILSGIGPLDAVLYQIVIMFLIAAASGLGTTLVVLLAYYRFFNADHQFLPSGWNEKASARWP
jgi:putative ABC transport system permease protein